MTIEELVAAVLAADREGVPALLARNLPPIFARPVDLHRELLGHEPDLYRQQLHHEAPRHPAAVALYWLEACTLTDGAFWEEMDGDAVLSPFGAALLAQLSLAGPADVGRPVHEPLDVSPTAGELHRLDALLRRQLAGGGRTIAELLLLGRLTRRALASSANANVAGERRALALTANALVEHLLAALDGSSMEEVRADIRREVAALRSAAAESEVPRPVASHQEMPGGEPEEGDLERAERLLERGRELLEQERYAEARPPLREAVALYRTLAARDAGLRGKAAVANASLGYSLVPPDAFGALADGPGSPGHLAAVFAGEPREELDEALAAEREAIALYRALADDDPARYRPMVARCLGLLGTVQLLRGDAAAASVALDEAIAILEDRADDDPEYAGLLTQARYLRVVVDQLALLGTADMRLLDDAPDPATARELANTVERLRPLAAGDAALRPRLAEALALLGIARGAQGLPEEASASLQEAADLYRGLADEDPGYGPALVRTLAPLGQALVESGRPGRALRVAREIVGRCRALAAVATSADERAALVLPLLGAGATLSTAGEDEEALEPLGEAAALARPLLAEDGHQRDQFAQALLNLGIALGGLGRETEMLRGFEEAEQAGIPVFSQWFPDKRPGWELLARLHLAFDDPAYLVRAIAVATDREGQIRHLLALVRDDSPDLARRIPEFAAPAFIEALTREGRRGEALTVELLARFLLLRQIGHAERWSAAESPRSLEMMEENAARMIAICRELRDEPCRARFLASRAGAILRSLRGGTPEAVAYLRESADVYRSLVQRDPAYRAALATVLTNLGAAVSEQTGAGSSEEALGALEEAVAVWRGLAGEDPGYRLDLVRALNNQGLALAQLTGPPSDPAEFARRPERFLAKAAPRAAYLLAFTKLGEALNLTLELMDEQWEIGITRAEVLVNMGAVAWLADDRSTALQLTDEALALYRRQADPGAAHHARAGIRLLRLRGTLLQERGEAERGPAALRASFEAFAEAVGLVEGYLVALPAQDAQLRFLGREDDVYQQIVDTCLLAADGTTGDDRREWQHRAWEYAERSRARLTLQTLVRTAADAPATSPRTAALQTWARLQRELEELYREVAAVLDSPARDARAAVATRAAEIREKEDAIARARREFGRDNPDLEALGNIAAPDLDAIQRQVRAIPDGALLVELFGAGDRLVVFVLDGRSLQVETVPVSPWELHAATASFREDGERVPDSSALDSALTLLGGHLAPVFERHLAALPPPSRDEQDRAPHLLLVPSGELHLWPLQALPLGDGTRLLDRVACVALPAASALPVLAKQVPLPGVYHGFAPPTEHSARPLQFALPQVHLEAALLDGTVVPGRAANREALRAVRGGIVAFATHAFADLDSPERSGVQLATEDPERPLEYVTALEFLVELPALRCALLLLWGCETHGSGVQSGDNWMGLTRAFLGTGRTLVASLWPISDAATLAVSFVFCRGLRAGLTIPQALRAGLRALRQVGAAELREWGSLAADALPLEERTAFQRSWRRAVAARAAGAPGQPPFGDLTTWAPYLAIGWPGLLPEPLGREDNA